MSVQEMYTRCFLTSANLTILYHWTLQLLQIKSNKSLSLSLSKKIASLKRQSLLFYPKI
jgi:hypothetical protein